MPDHPDNESDLNVSFHPRLSEYNRLVYPVVSRRAGGLSLGVNVNPQKRCTFDCIYCQVDRTQKITELSAGVDQIMKELHEWIGEIMKSNGAYRGTPLKDISIAGDGEPTMKPFLPQLMSEMVALKAAYDLKNCKLVLFTNGSRLNREDLQPAIGDFIAAGGEIWFKLDSWDEESFKAINRSKLSFDTIINNLIQVGKNYPLVLQSCFFSWDGEPLDTTKYRPYVERVSNLLEKGVNIKLIQLYTVARKPADERVQPWSNEAMDAIYAFLSQNLDLEIKTYYKNG